MPDLDISVADENEAMRLLSHHFRICRALFEATDRPMHAIETRLRVLMNDDQAALTGAVGFLTYIDQWYNTAEGDSDVA